MNNTPNDNWEQFLTPEILKSNLLLVSLFSTVFEILKNSIIDRLKEFYSFDIESNQSKYQSEVLSKNKSPVYSSLYWLKENNVLDDKDIKLFTQAKDTRNILAHETPRILFEGPPDNMSEYLLSMVYLLKKIETWWIVNFLLPTNENFDGMLINEEDIIPGPIAGVKIMIDIALGSDELAYYYIKEYTTRKLFGLDKD